MLRKFHATRFTFHRSLLVCACASWALPALRIAKLGATHDAGQAIEFIEVCTFTARESRHPTRRRPGSRASVADCWAHERSMVGVGSQQIRSVTGNKCEYESLCSAPLASWGSAHSSIVLAKPVALRAPRWEGDPARGRATPLGGERPATPCGGEDVSFFYLFVSDQVSSYICVARTNDKTRRAGRGDDIMMTA
jgi:hypothetical protein